MTRVDDVSLPKGYKSVGDKIVYNKAYDKTAELLMSDKVRKSEV